MDFPCKVQLFNYIHTMLIKMYLFRNPKGRTGLRGRGVLGRWGPNHAADPILTSWCRDEYGNKILNRDSKKPILQFVAIEGIHGGEWAIPGVNKKFS